jgi:hypothetical protein
MLKLTMNVAGKETLFHTDKICRLCLSRKRGMLSIFYEDGTSLPIASRIFTYIGIEVSSIIWCIQLTSLTALHKELVFRLLE